MPNTWRVIRHLLRRLSDPYETARNALVTPLFSAADAASAYAQARTIVLDAVESLHDTRTRRRYDIVTLYDLRGEPLNDVLRVLSIEKSQFYRERSAALRHVEAFVRSRVQEHLAAPVSHAHDYEIAAALHRSGNAALARSIFERVAQTASGFDKGRCLLRIAELHADGGDAASAAALVTQALTHADGGGAKAQLLQCDASVVNAQISWASGAGERAGETLRGAITCARQLISAGEDGAAGLLGKALALQATIAFHTATLDECSGLVSAGYEILCSDPARNADTLADLLTIRTSICTAKPGALDDAKSNDDALIAFAQRHALLRKFAVGIKDLAVIQHYRGNRAEAQIYADQALALSSTVSNTKERAVATFEWAHMRIESGDAVGVREAIAGVRCHLPRGGFWYAYAHAIDAFALLAQREPAQALEQADTALSCFRFIKSDRGIGIARSLQSRALRMLGAKSESRLRAEQAVEHLERAPQAFWLPYAKELLAAASL